MHRKRLTGRLLFTTFGQTSGRPPTSCPIQCRNTTGALSLEGLRRPLLSPRELASSTTDGGNNGLTINQPWTPGNNNNSSGNNNRISVIQTTHGHPKMAVLLSRTAQPIRAASNTTTSTAAAGDTCPLP